MFPLKLGHFDVYIANGRILSLQECHNAIVIPLLIDRDWVSINAWSITGVSYYPDQSDFLRHKIFDVVEDNITGL